MHPESTGHGRDHLHRLASRERVVREKHPIRALVLPGEAVSALEMQAVKV